MKSTFATLKNGKNAETVWANPTTKEIVLANRNSFGFNMETDIDSEFDAKYRGLPVNQGKSDYRKFYYSAKSMQSIGFQLVKRGENTLW